MTNLSELRENLRSATGRLACLEAYQRSHGVKPPLLDQTTEYVRAMTAELVAARRKETNMPRATIDSLTTELKDVQDQMRALHAAAGNRALTTPEQARWDALEADAADIETGIKQLQDRAAREARQAEHRAKWGGMSVTGRDQPGDLDPDTVERMNDRQARDAALRLLDRSAEHLSDAQKADVEKLVRAESTPDLDATALNRHIALTNSDDYRSAFRKLTGRWVSNVIPLSERENAAVVAVMRSSMAEGSGATGGYAVPAFLDPTIVLNAQGSANPIRRIARNETITTKTWKGVGTTGVSWEFVPEGTASTDASPTVSQPSIDAHMARCWITYSIELEQDAVELERQLFRLLGNGWDETVAEMLATGSGTGQPKGVITALDAITGSEVSITAAGALAPADISKVWVALPDRARENASWVMNESVRETVAAWGDEFGNRSVDLGGRLQNLRGRPVYSTDKFPAIETTTGSANQMVVGDFSGYLIAQRAGMTVEPVNTVVDGNGLPLGKRGLFAWARIGADVVDSGLLRLLQQ